MTERPGLDHVLIKGVEWWPFGRRYEVQIHMKESAAGVSVVLSPGYRWDGPTGLPVIGGFGRRLVRISAFHDALYGQGRQDRVLKSMPVTRAHADRFLLEMQKRAGTSAIGRLLTGLMVRLFGRPFFEVEQPRRT